MKRSFIIMLIALGAFACSDNDPKPVKPDAATQTVSAKNDDKDATEKPPAGSTCDSSNFCCWGSPGSGLRCRQY